MKNMKVWHIGEHIIIHYTPRMWAFGPDVAFDGEVAVILNIGPLSLTVQI